MLKLNNDSRRQPNELHTYSHLCGKQWQAWLPAWQCELLRQYSKQQQQRCQQMRQLQLLSRSGIAASGCQDDWQKTTTCNQNKCKLQSAFSLALWLCPLSFSLSHTLYRVLLCSLLLLLFSLFGTNECYSFCLLQIQDTLLWKLYKKTFYDFSLIDNYFILTKINYKIMLRPVNELSTIYIS